MDKTKVESQTEEFGDELSIALIMVSMMIAGLDGEVSPEEYVAFEDVMSMSGCSEEKANELFEKGLESAGYIVLQSRRLSDGELLDAFVRRVERLFPCGLDGLDILMARKAFMIWMVMVKADGRYVEIERRGMHRLQEVFNQKRCDDVGAPLHGRISDECLIKCEQWAEKFLSAQKAYEAKPTIVNKNRRASVLRRINEFLEVC